MPLPTMVFGLRLAGLLYDRRFSDDGGLVHTMRLHDLDYLERTLHQHFSYFIDRPKWISQASILDFGEIGLTGRW